MFWKNKLRIKDLGVWYICNGIVRFWLISKCFYEKGLSVNLESLFVGEWYKLGVIL